MYIFTGLLAHLLRPLQLLVSQSNDHFPDGVKYKWTSTVVLNINKQVYTKCALKNAYSHDIYIHTNKAIYIHTSEPIYTYILINLHNMYYNTLIKSTRASHASSLGIPLFTTSLPTYKSTFPINKQIIIYMKYEQNID